MYIISNSPKLCQVFLAVIKLIRNDHFIFKIKTSKSMIRQINNQSELV